MTGDVIDPRLKKFRDKKIKHIHLEIPLNKLIRLAVSARPESIIVFTGPGGSGKTTTLDALKKHLRHVFADRMQRDPGFLPYLSIEAVAGLDGNFNWKDGLTRTLSSAGEILINQKALNRFEADLDGEKVAHLRSLVREELRRALEHLVRFREIPILIIDEASAILLGKNAMAPLLQFEILKSLAVQIKIPILLCGAYDLLGILDGTGQLVRRSDVVHLSRYLVDGTTESHNDAGELVPIPDRDHFRNAVATLLESMDVEKEVDFLLYLDYFLMKSIGCIGNLKDWLDRGLVETLATPARILTRDIIMKAALPNKTLIRLTNEALIGEKILRELPDDDLAHLMGYVNVPTLDSISGSPAVHQQTNSPKQKRRPGQRGPSRDPIGGLHA